MFQLWDHIYKIRDIAVNNIQVESVEVYVDEENTLSSTELWVKLQTYIHTQIRDIEPCSINRLKVKWYAQGFVQT